MVKQWDKDIVLEFTQAVTKISVTNAKEEVVELVKDTDYTVNGNAVTLKAETITGKGTDYYPLNTQFVFTSADDRTTTYNLQILYADPPALAEEQTAPQIVEEALAAGLTLDITYEREEDYTVLLDGEELTATDDYTVAWASNTITLALKKEVVNGLEQGLHTFTLKTMAGSVEYKVFRKTAQDEWVNAGTMDDKAGGVASDGNPESVVKDGAGNTTVHMGMLSRVYYSEPIDLSETLYLELDINKLEKGSGHGWFVIGLTSDVTQLATFDQGATKTLLSLLYDHTKGEFQCPNFVGDLPTQAKPEYINQNGPQLFAFTITAEGTIVTFNGQQIWNTDVWTLESFAGGKAYIGIFSGHGYARHHHPHQSRIPRGEHLRAGIYARHKHGCFLPHVQHVGRYRGEVRRRNARCEYGLYLCGRQAHHQGQLFADHRLCRHDAVHRRCGRRRAEGERQGAVRSQRG